MRTTNGPRLGVVDTDGRGTPASAWAGWAATAGELDVSAWREVVVVAPHPDDEVLGLGGVMRRLVGQGVEVRVVGVTDGDAAVPPGTWSPQRLARERVEEAASAVALLGVPRPERLGLPDGHVAAHEDALADALADRLGPGVTCLSTWRADGHPDHEATGRAAARACAQTGATLLEYPVWMWHWAGPGDPAVPWDRVRTVSLDAHELEAKRRAVQCHRSQLDPPVGGADPVLPPFVIDRLVTAQEMVLL